MFTSFKRSAETPARFPVRHPSSSRLLGTLGCNLTPYDRDLARIDARRPPSAGGAGSAALASKLPEAAVRGSACGGHGRPGGVCAAFGGYYPALQWGLPPASATPLPWSVRRSVVTTRPCSRLPSSRPSLPGFVLQNGMTGRYKHNQLDAVVKPFFKCLSRPHFEIQFNE